MTVDIREVLEGAEPGIDRVLRRAFGAQDPATGGQIANLWNEVRASGHLLAEFVAVADGAIVGHVGVSHCWLDARRELVDVAVLSPLSTDPDHQGAGVGTALVAAAIAWAGAAGRPALFLEGSPAFYGARGFERASARGFEAPSRRIPDPAFQVVTFANHAAWMSGRVVYPEVWWRHDSVGLRDPEPPAP